MAIHPSYSSPNGYDWDERFSPRSDPEGRDWHRREARKKLKLETPREKAAALFRPPRDPHDPTNLINLYKKQRANGHWAELKAARRRGDTHQFYRLPEDLRAAATDYFQMLCRRHADRIKEKPNFWRILHMATLNRFKNPHQRLHAILIRRSRRAQRIQAFNPQILSNLKIGQHILASKRAKAKEAKNSPNVQNVQNLQNFSGSQNLI